MKHTSLWSGIALVATLGLTACDNNNDSGGPPPPPAMSRLTMSGQVVDAPIANAAVVISVGSQIVTGTADATGHYSIPVEILTTDAGKPVSISATGVGTQAEARLASLLGSFSALQTAAGSDNLLDSSENFRVNITNLSTAESVLAREANGGNTPDSAESLATALRSVDQDQLLELATLVKLVVDFNVPLPNGVPDTLQLISSAATRTAFLDNARSAENNDTYLAARDQTLSDPALTPGVAAADLPYSLFLTVTGTQNPNFRCVAFLSEGFKFNVDGSGRYSNNTVDSSAMRWTIDGSGSIAITFATPATFGPYSRADRDPATGRFITFNCTDETTNLLVLRTSVGSATRNISVQTRCDDARFNADFTNTESRSWLPADASLRYTATELPGRAFTLLFDRTGSPNVLAGSGGALGGNVEIGFDVARFAADGSGSLQVTGITFQWQVDADGALRASFPNGTVVRYRRTVAPFAKAEVAVAEFRLIDGRRFVADQFGYTADGSLSFATATMPGVYYQFGVGGFDYNPISQTASLEARCSRTLRWISKAADACHSGSTGWSPKRALEPPHAVSVVLTAFAHGAFVRTAASSASSMIFRITQTSTLAAPSIPPIRTASSSMSGWCSRSRTVTTADSSGLKSGDRISTTR